MVILGDGSERSFVARDSAERDDVHYFGTVPYGEVPGYMHLADVGISLIDDLNTLKVVEYGASGLPAVQLEGISETRFGDRLRYCAADPEDIAATVRDAESVETTSLQEFSKRYDWSSIADTYEAAPTRALGSN